LYVFHSATMFIKVNKNWCD